MFRLRGQSNVAKLLFSSVKGQQCLTANLLKPLQAATICHKDDIDPEILESKPKRWNWEKKPYSQLHSFIGVDRAVNRYDENTVVISIEGNIGVGKSTFAKALADALGMRYYPEPTVDLIYKRADGFDFRSLNYKLPEACHFLDAKLFWLNPDHQAVVGFELNMFLLRAWDYMNALAHVLSTGQGVITDRSPWSSWAFQTASHKMKFGRCGKSFYRFAQHCRDELIPELLRPHVVIYLDAPADVCLERVKKRGIEHEINSKAMCKEYLNHIEFTYKDHVLPELEHHAEVLVYDWTDPPDLNLVIDDLSKLDVHSHATGEKAEDWRFNAELYYDAARQYYTTNREQIYSLFYQDTFWIPDILLTPEDIDHRELVFEVHVPPFHVDKKTDTLQNILRTALMPNFLRGTYLDRKDYEAFQDFAPRRPTSYW